MTRKPPLPMVKYEDKYLVVLSCNADTPRVISNVKMNKYLKELGELVTALKEPTTKTSTKGGHTVTDTKEKWRLITTHTVRSGSFITKDHISIAKKPVRPNILPALANYVHCRYAL